MWIYVLCTVLAGYLLGNLNGAIVASHIIAHEDVRNQGSGNAGLTNFIRGYGIQNTLLVFLLDGGKAVLSCLIGGWLLGTQGLALEGRMLGGFAVVMAILQPFFFRLRSSCAMPV